MTVTPPSLPSLSPSRLVPSPQAQFTSTPKAKDLDSRPSTTPPAEKELDEYKYDQSKGIEDGYEGPETEI